MVLVKVCRICHLSNSRGTSPVFSEGSIPGKSQKTSWLINSHHRIFYQQPHIDPSSSSSTLAERNTTVTGWLSRTLLRLRKPVAVVEEDSSEFIAPCECRGTMRYVHRSCLNTWRMSSPRRDSFSQCEQCFTPYRFACGRLARILVHSVTISVASVLVYLGLMLLAFRIVQSAMEFPMGGGHGTHPPYSYHYRYYPPTTPYTTNLSFEGAIKENPLLDRLGTLKEQTIDPSHPTPTEDSLLSTPTVPTPTDLTTPPTPTPATTNHFLNPPIWHHYSDPKIDEMHIQILDKAARWLHTNQAALTYTGTLLTVIDWFFVSPGSPLPLLLFILLLLWRSLGMNQVWAHAGLWLCGLGSAVRFGLLAHERVTYHIRRYVQLNFSIIQSCPCPEGEDD